MIFTNNNIKQFNKVKDIINLILAIFITTTPILTVLLHILGSDIMIHELFQIYGVLYLVFLPIPILLLFTQKGAWRNIVAKLKRLPVILVLALFGWIFLSCCINDSFNIFLFYFIIYLFIFISMMILNEKYEKIILNTLIITLATCCFLGLLDPANKFMPGFDIGYYPLSLMLYNPNYSGYAMALIAIYNVWVMCTTDSSKQRVISIISYVLFAIFLFMNGSFAPITFVFLTLILMIIFMWIKEKQCPTKIIISTLGLIPFIFLVDLIPNINDYRTCDYNYFLECIAVLDNYLGTNMLRMFGIDKIVGADGWDRSERQAAALAECLSNMKTFLFGNGAGGNFEFLPHNTFLCLWLNFGIVATLLYYSIYVYLVVRFFKLKNNRNCVGLVFSVIGYVIMLMTGDLIEYSFIFHMLIFGLAYKNVEQGHVRQLKITQEEHIQKYLDEQAKLKGDFKKTTKRKTSTSKTPTSSSSKKTTSKTSSSTTRKSSTSSTTKSSSSTSSRKKSTSIKKLESSLNTLPQENYDEPENIEMVIDTPNTDTSITIHDTQNN